MSKINTISDLRALYGYAKGRAADKVIYKLEKHSKQFISLSPFCLMATFNIAGSADVSPKGDAPGFVQMPNDKTLLIPDRPGNNRIDGLCNIIGTPSIGLLFLIPGVMETLRVNGTAEISIDETLLSRFEVQGKLPKSVIIVTIEEIFLHCAKSIMRSSLWDNTAQIDRKDLPTISEMINDQIGSKEAIETNADMIARYKKSLY